jgi:hypothetical protein
LHLKALLLGERKSPGGHSSSSMTQKGCTRLSLVGHTCTVAESARLHHREKCGGTSAESGELTEAVEGRAARRMPVRKNIPLRSRPNHRL